jgi:hypothetical protein
MADNDLRKHRATARAQMDPAALPDPPSELPGVEHRYIRTPGNVTIHVADAGPSDGPPIMLVHGFPQNWWEWHGVIGPLAGDLQAF